MKLSDFKIGCKFRCQSIAIYICTDIGSRVIVASAAKEIKSNIDKDILMEVVFNEFEINLCQSVPDDYEDHYWKPLPSESKLIQENGD